MMEIAEEQPKDEVWIEVIIWVEKEQLPENAETRSCCVQDERWSVNVH